MMPLGDDNSGRRTAPVVTYGLIAVNLLFFFLEISGGDPFIMQWSFVPSRFMANPAAEFVTIFTSMFMHAGWVHLGGNMLYLWIFGDNVEDRFGHVPYLIFYILCGIAATFSQLVFSIGSSIPNLGLFPQGRVRVLMGRAVTTTSALIVLGMWIVLQFFSQIAAITSAAGESGGVAYMAHIGGFVAGVVLTFLFTGGRPASAAGRLPAR
jgi:membrane associated rhomboid family serine protease